ncbi:papain-like cysteine protease family protein [Longispora sp. NPDC051575]|uniref:papain-like cysteine protease family protein n=1 Tax=Longispora sp. NPDC051575 TaxID=3154943 RepID=UPI0034447EDE
MHKTRRRLGGAVAVLTALLVTTLPATPAFAASKQLGITQQVQSQNQWCWAASGLTIARYLGYGASTSQNTFCDYGRGYPAGTTCPNQPAELSNVQRAFQALGLRPGTVTGALSYTGVQTEINGNRPIETGIYWTAGGGHAQVIYGYDTATNSIFWGDPWPSSQRYSQASHSYYVSNGQFRWAQSLYRIGL